MKLGHSTTLIKNQCPQLRRAFQHFTKVHKPWWQLWSVFQQHSGWRAGLFLECLEHLKIWSM